MRITNNMMFDSSIRNLNNNLQRLSDAQTKYSTQSKIQVPSDDPVIAPVEIERYRQALPSAEIRVMSAPDHFMREEFPEVLDAIKPLQAALQ